MRILPAIVSVVLLSTILAQSRQQQQATALREQWLRVVFGLDETSATWDGRLTVEHGQVIELEEWAFEARDRLDRKSQSWQITTELAQHRRATYAEPFRGLLLRTNSAIARWCGCTRNRGLLSFLPHDCGRVDRSPC